MDSNNNEESSPVILSQEERIIVLETKVMELYNLHKNVLDHMRGLVEVLVFQKQEEDFEDLKKKSPATAE
jgi:hypothetical protein